MLVVAGLVVNSLLPEPQLWVLFVAAAGIAACTAIRRPPMDALMPQLVERDGAEDGERAPVGDPQRRADGGPAVAGVLIATVDLSVYAVDLVTFAFSLACLAAMKAVPPPPDADRPSWALRRGLRYARSRPELMGTYLVDINAMFFGMPQALYPFMAGRSAAPPCSACCTRPRRSVRCSRRSGRVGRPGCTGTG